MDFIDLYLYHVGRSEVPKQFHLFCALSLLSASLGDRCWFDRDTSGRRIYPNLYVFLVGPSGSGKEIAVSTAMRLVEGLDILGIFPVTGITKQSLIDRVSCLPTPDQPCPPHIIYLITEELGMAVPSKELGRDLIKFMTGHYIPTGLPSFEGTRMHGIKRLPSPLFNWLCGTNEEWLRSAIEKDAIEGGFFARVLAVRGQRDGTIRHAEMCYPDDFQDCRRRLRAWLEMLTTLRMRFVKTIEATLFYRNWYESETLRPSPTEKILEPAFNRSDEMVHRLSMLLRVAKLEGVPLGVTDLEVGVSHIQEAIAIWEALMRDVPEIVKIAAATKESGEVEIVREVVRRLKVVDHSSLLRRVGNRGLNAERLRPALSHLIEAGEVKQVIEGEGRTRRAYQWVG